MTQRRVYMPARDARHAPCTAEQRETLADALGDTPETVISVHALKRGYCRAYASEAASIVQWDVLLGEPVGFGDDAAALWDLMQSVDGWFCVEVTTACAAALGQLIVAETGRRVRYYGDIYYTLTVPATHFHGAAVRLLTVADMPLLDAAPREIQGAGFGETRALLEEGVVAGAIVDGALVTIAHTSALTTRHADIGVATLEGWRGRGFASAAAALVAGHVQATGRTPVWSTGEDNVASRRVAEKLGFVEVGQRVYVIVEA